ncbi:MAG: T9SS type A sorting domain-containing protein [Bacteroidetes bacterium]|nr:T9SS type A sorting domain-containing protein [Bacteroidota bacterium]
MLKVLSVSFLVIFNSFSVYAQWVNGQAADAVLGQMTYSSTRPAMAPVPDRIGEPRGVAIDKKTGKIFILDGLYQRVARWPSVENYVSGTQPELFFGEPIDPVSGTNIGGPLNATLAPSASGVAIDSTGRLFVSDTFNHRVLFWDQAVTRETAGPADGVLGQPDLFSNSRNRGTGPQAWTLAQPRGLQVEKDRLWVVDQGNNRVLRFDGSSSLTTGDTAVAVLGQTGFTIGSSALSASRFNSPWYAALDSSGNLFVADMNNYRILRFDNAAGKSNGAPADGILGQSNFEANQKNRGGSVSASGFDFVFGLTAENQTLWVGENNNRILRFDLAAGKANGADADGVLGQPDFTSSKPGLSASSLRGSGYLAAAGGRLFVLDFGNRRLLWFNQAASKVNGAGADGVLGAPDMESLPAIQGPSSLRSPGGVAIDTLRKKVYISDSGNNRVLRFDMNSLMTGAEAEAVFGQASFSVDLANRGGDPAANTLSFPYGIAVDPLSGRLWVIDRGNARLLRFDQAWEKPSGSPADGVLGQPDFTTVNLAGNSAGTLSASTISTTAIAVAVDKYGTVFLADGTSTTVSRILRWNQAHLKESGAPADGVLGQADFTSGSRNRGGSANANTLSSPNGIAVDSVGTLWVSDGLNNRILWFTNASAKADGSDADGVLGQNSFTTTVTSGNANNVLTPVGIAVDDNGNLYIGDTGNRRVMVWYDAGEKPSGASADRVLGQAAFGQIFEEVGQAVNFPATGLAVNSQTGELFVSILSQNRVLRLTGSSVLTSVQDVTEPASFRLLSAYPNPFNPTSRIRFSLDRPGEIRLDVFDLTGKRVAVLADNQRFPAGESQLFFNATGLSSGVYLIRLLSGNQSETIRAVLIR